MTKNALPPLSSDHRADDGAEKIVIDLASSVQEGAGSDTSRSSGDSEASQGSNSSAGTLASNHEEKEEENGFERQVMVLDETTARNKDEEGPSDLDSKVAFVNRANESPGTSTPSSCDSSLSAPFVRVAPDSTMTPVVVASSAKNSWGSPSSRAAERTSHSKRSGASESDLSTSVDGTAPLFQRANLDNASGALTSDRDGGNVETGDKSVGNDELWDDIRYIERIITSSSTEEQLFSAKLGRQQLETLPELSTSTPEAATQTEVLTTATHYETPPQSPSARQTKMSVDSPESTSSHSSGSAHSAFAIKYSSLVPLPELERATSAPAVGSFGEKRASMAKLDGSRRPSFTKLDRSRRPSFSNLDGNSPALKRNSFIGDSLPKKTSLFSWPKSSSFLSPLSHRASTKHARQENEVRHPQPEEAIESNAFAVAEALLVDTSFIQRRLDTMGILAGTRQHMADCIGLIRRVRAILYDSKPEAPPEEAQKTQAGLQSDAFANMIEGRAAMVDLKAVTTTACRRLARRLGRQDDSATRPVLARLRRRSRNIGEEVGLAYREIGRVLYEQGWYTESIEFLRIALRVLRLRLGKYDLQVAATLRWYGIVQTAMGNYHRATTSFAAAVAIYKSQFGPVTTDVEYIETMRRQGNALERQGKLREAMDIYEDIMQIHTAEEADDRGSIISGFSVDVSERPKPLHRVNAAVEESAAPRSFVCSLILRDMGDVRRSWGEYHAAMDLYIDALKRLQPRKSPPASPASTERMLLATSPPVQLPAPSPTAMSRSEDWTDDSGVGDMMRRMGQVDAAFGRYEKAMEHFREAEASERLELGEYHPSVAETIHEMGMVSLRMGRYNEAQLKFKKALRIREDLLGKEHRDTAETMCAIASVEYMRGEYGKAMQMYADSVQSLGSALGQKHPLVAMALLGISDVHLVRGKHRAAMERCQEAVGILKAAVGANHPDMAVARKIVGDVHHFLGAYADALKTYRQAEVIVRSSFGLDHPFRAVLLHSVGNIDFAFGKYDEALEHYREALRIEEVILGKEHHHVAQTLHSIANVYVEQANYEDAQLTYLEALRVKRAVLGDVYHVDLAATIQCIGNLHFDIGEYDAALDHYVEAHRITRKLLGKNHPNVAATIYAVGNVQYATGHYGDAMASFQEAVRIERVALGSGHVGVAASLDGVGNVYFELGEDAKAMRCYDEALRAKKLVLGDDHREVATTLHRIGHVFFRAGRYEDAMDTYREAHRVLKDVRREGHGEVASTLLAMANVHAARGRYDEAMEVYRNGLRSLKSVWGRSQKEIAATLHSVGALYSARGKKDEAMHVYLLSLRATKLVTTSSAAAAALHEVPATTFDTSEKGPVGHGNTFKPDAKAPTSAQRQIAITLQSIGAVHRLNGRWDEAIEALEEALGIYRSLGEAAVSASSSNWIVRGGGKHRRSSGGHESDNRVGGCDRRSVSTILRLIGDIYTEKRQYDDALESYSDALRVLMLSSVTLPLSVASPLEGAGAGSVNGSATRPRNKIDIDRHDAATLLERIAVVCESVGNVTFAVQARREANEFLNSSLLDPTSNSKLPLTRRLSLSLSTGSKSLGGDSRASTRIVSNRSGLRVRRSSILA